eukprot:evm.model.NODE_25201_length_48748_cov_29.326208.7
MDESAEGGAGKAAQQPPSSSSPPSSLLPSSMEEEGIAFSLGSSKPVTPTKGGGGGIGRAGGRHHHHHHHHHHQHHRSAFASAASSSSSLSSFSSLSSAAAGGGSGAAAAAVAAAAGRSPATPPLFGGLSSSSSSDRIATATREGGVASAFQGFTPPSTSFSTLPPAADQQRELQQAAQTFREKASSLYLGKNYEKSLHEFTNALLLAPDGWSEKPKLYCNRAAALIMLHRYEDAVKDCEKAIQGDPHLLKAYTRCGRAYLHMGVLDRAYVCFEEVRSRAEQRLLAKFGPDAPTPPVVMTTPGGGSSSNSSSREGAYQQRAAAHEKKSLDEAIQEAKEGRAEVSMVEQALRAAEMHSKRVEWGEALERVDAALRFAHRAKNAMRLKLLALCKLKRWEDGVRFCEKYYAPSKAELFPTTSTSSSTGTSSSPSSLLHPNPHAPIHVVVRMGSLEQRSYIRCLRYTDREDDAVAALKTLLARHGHVMWVEKELVRIKSIRHAKEAGDAAFRKQNFDLALGQYAEALKLDPEWDMMNAVLHCNRGAAHMALRLFEQAKDDCTHALRRKPDYWKAFLRRARAWREMKRWGESVADYTTYLKHGLPKGAAGEGEEGKEGGGAGGPTGATGSAADVRSEMEGVQREMKLEKLEKERREFAKKQQQQQQQQRQRQQSSSGWRGGGGGGYRGWGRGRGSIFGEGESDKEDEDGDEDEDEDEEDGAGIFQDFFEFYRKHNNRESERGARGGASFASTSERRTPGTAPPGAGRSSSSSSRSGFEGSYRRGFNFSGAGPGNGGGSSSSSGSGARSSRSSTSGWGRSRSSSSVPPSASSSSSSSGVVTHYSVLGIARASSSGEVKKAFHRLALRFHPDKNKEAGAEEMFKKVSEAYNVLSDHSARRLYDAELRVGGGGF